MKYDFTIEELMSRLSCKRWPARFRGFYDEVREALRKNGHPLLDPAYYDELNEKYRVLPTYKELYKEVAAKIAASEELSLYFALLCRALCDRDLIKADLDELDMPQPREGLDPVACRVLPGLAICQSIPAVYEVMKKRGVPDDILYPSLRVAEAGVSFYMDRHNGEAGYANFGWWQRAYDATIYSVGRLEMEIPREFPSTYAVYGNEAGDTVVFAKDMKLHRDGFAFGSYLYEDEEGAWTPTFEETEDSYVGHPFLANGYVSREKRTLSKKEWHPVLEGGDPVIGLHIPGGGGMTVEAVEDSFSRMRELLKNCFPEYDCKAFTCASWLIDPALVDILGADSNISKFCSRFTPMCMKSAARGVFTFIFGKTDSDFEYSELPENSRLERGLKNHYMSGKAIYEMYGFFL